VPAPTLALNSPFSFSDGSTLAVAPSGDVYLTSTDPQKPGVVRVQRSSGLFQQVVGCISGPCTPYFGADGVSGPLVNLRDPTNPDDGGSGRSWIVGLRDGHLLVGLSRLINDHVTGYVGSDDFMKYYRLSDFVQFNFAGKLGIEGPNWVNDALPRSQHYVALGQGGAWQSRPDSVFDPVGHRWIHPVQWYAFDARTIGLPDFLTDPSVDPNDVPIELLDQTGGSPAVLTLGPLSAIAYRRAGADELVYYCYDYSSYVPTDPKNGRLFVKNITNGALSILPLPWPVASLQCTGRKMIWDAARNALIFAYARGSLYGLAEYVNPPMP
jgi:hypothetical protein